MIRPPIRQGASRLAKIRAHGCMIASLAYLTETVAPEAVPPRSDQDAMDTYLNRLVRLAGMGPAAFDERGTKITEAEQAYESQRLPDRLAPQMRLLRGGSVRGDLLPELKAGRWAVVALNYGVLQDARPRKAVGSFRGGHACCVGDYRGSDDTVALVDPLRSEVVRISVALLTKAMETFGRNPWGNGRGEAGVAMPSPTFEALWTKAKADLKTARADVRRLVGERDEALERAAQAEGDLAACQQQTVPPDPAALEAARLAGLGQGWTAARKAAQDAAAGIPADPPSTEGNPA